MYEHDRIENDLCATTLVVLIIAGKEDLGQLAQEALDRLIEKVGLPREQVLAGNSTSVVATS